jgi:hypothetical protein
MQEARRHDNQMKPSHRLFDGTRSLRDRVFISKSNVIEMRFS